MLTLGKKLKALVDKEEGNFARVEMTLKRWRSQEVVHGKDGAWVTKVYLTDFKKWSKNLDPNIFINGTYVNQKAMPACLHTPCFHETSYEEDGGQCLCMGRATWQTQNQ